MNECESINKFYGGDSDKLKKGIVADIRNYSAQCDGYHSDYIPLMDAIKFIRENGGGWLIVPPKTYIGPE